ncbi:hypothetical protein [Sphingomonas sp. R1]|jgi:hypothetical protein|uniref:hypothetical protein n=1 Tax=Sphingomonas sp. R1 TaxID=399176 RepID=UPI00222451D0|nr:hypothetical protein [Sphingomonas sp. R1]UYY75986.1 hypothetical protein OIM94_10610 [Sphingomonas sp. R1]
MRKSPDFSRLRITAATSMALLAAGCGGSNVANQAVRYCTDAAGRRIADANCGSGGGGHGGGSGHYYYASRGAAVPAIGEAARGGSYQPASGVRYGGAEAVTRGGFGRSGGFFGSRGG